MSYFKDFPTISYDATGDKNFKKIRDITTRIKFKTAIQNKNVARILTKAGLTTSNRDAIIPQFSNRLLFAQTKNPIVRILAQFTTWAQAKTSQTNKIIQRIENGDVRHLTK